MDPSHERGSEVAIQPLAHESPERNRSDRTDREPLDAGPDRRHQVERVGRADCRSLRDHDGDRLVREPAQRERESAGGWGVDPLHIVDRDRERGARRESTQDAEDREGDRSSIWTGASRPPQQQGRLEGVPLAGGQVGHRPFRGGNQQVAKYRERHPRLGFGRPRRQYEAPALREPDGFAPQRRLADPGIALEHQRA